MAKAYIFGGGGHARVMASFLSVSPVFVVQPGGQATLPGDTLSEDEYFRELPRENVYIGIGSNEEREQNAGPKPRTIALLFFSFVGLAW